MPLRQIHFRTSHKNRTYSEKYILGRIEACCVDACGVGWVTLTHHPAGEAGDGALSDGALLTLSSP